jgi:putative aminopeptidase FrvX
MADGSGEGRRLEIDIDYLREQLAELLRVPSPTGYTDTIVRYVCGELDRLDVSYDVTRRGAIRGHLKGGSPAGARAIVSTSTRSARRSRR